MWTMGLNTPSANSLTTPNCVVQLTCWREGMPSTGSWTGLRGGLMQTSWTSTRPSARSWTWDGAISSPNKGWVENGWKAALRRRTWGCWLTRRSTWPINVWSQPRRQTISWAASKEAWPAGQERWFYYSTLLWWDLTWRPASSSEALNTGKKWSCWTESRGGPQIWSEGWNTSSVRKGWESWVYSAWTREVSGETLPYSSLPVPEGAHKKIWKRLLTRACGDRTRDSKFSLTEGRFGLHTGKKFFMMRVVRHGTSCPEKLWMPTP